MLAEKSISQHYYISNTIGAGGQGSVVLAQKKSDDSRVALKLIPFTPTNQHNIVQEISAIKAISTPNCNPYVVCYRDSFVDVASQKVVIEMDYVHGPNVISYTQPLRDSGNNKLLTTTAIQLTRAMLKALSFIHSYGILHNDIKPANIVVNIDKVPVLVDLGISCFVQAALQEICTKPYDKLIDNCCSNSSGTSLYLPPEALKNVRYPASDLWSLGATIFEIVNGYNIWSIDITLHQPMVLMRQVIDKFVQGVQPNQLRTENQVLNQVINNFLNYDPTQRMSVAQAISMLETA